jgi:hypothetical protein
MKRLWHGGTQWNACPTIIARAGVRQGICALELQSSGTRAIACQRSTDDDAAEWPPPQTLVREGLDATPRTAASGKCSVARLFNLGVFSCYFHVSEAHLHRYAAERDFVYNHRERLGFDDLARADAALVGAKSKRLTYATPRSRGAGEPPF